MSALWDEDVAERKSKKKLIPRLVAIGMHQLPKVGRYPLIQ